MHLPEQVQCHAVHQVPHVRFQARHVRLQARRHAAAPLPASPEAVPTAGLLPAVRQGVPQPTAALHREATGAAVLRAAVPLQATGVLHRREATAAALPEVRTAAVHHLPEATGVPVRPTAEAAGRQVHPAATVPRQGEDNLK